MFYSISKKKKKRIGITFFSILKYIYYRYSTSIILSVFYSQVTLIFCIMKNLSCSILGIFCFFSIFLSFQNVYYKCIKPDKASTGGNTTNANSSGGSNILVTDWSNTGYNFMDLLTNGYLKDMNVDEIKEELANDLANKIQDAFIKHMSTQDLSKITSIDSADVEVLKDYVKDITGYVGYKAAELLEENIEEAVNEYMSKEPKEDNSKNNVAAKIDLHFNDVDKDTINKETDELVNEMVDEYENQRLEQINKHQEEKENENAEEKEINAHTST